MQPRLQNDPDRYIRRVKGERYQARPWCDGERYELGLFPTMHAARKAILEFWWGKREPRPRFVRTIHSKAGPRFLAMVFIEGALVRLYDAQGRPTFAKEDDAAEAVKAFLIRAYGEEGAQRILRRK